MLARHTSTTANGTSVGTRKNPRAWPVAAATTAQTATISNPGTALRSGWRRYPRHPNTATATTAAAMTDGTSAPATTKTTRKAAVGAATSNSSPTRRPTGCAGDEVSAMT